MHRKMVTQYPGNILKHCIFWKQTQRHQVFDYAINLSVIMYGSTLIQKWKLTWQHKYVKYNTTIMHAPHPLLPPTHTHIQIDM